MAVILRRLLRIGRLPGALRAELEPEGILFFDEYVPVTRRFHGAVPGLRSSGSIASYVGALVLTEDRVLGTLSSVPKLAGRTIDLRWDEPQAGAVKAVLNILAKDSRANIVSSPSIMVLNNQQASIQVGDQVPITTQQQQSTSTNSNVINNIEFRDTGVLLTVTPRVNSGGLVIMEVEQEVSNVRQDDANTLTPTIQQRKIASTVAVQSAETVVLGGLIRENKAELASGIPGLYKLPVVGKLFGTETDSAGRTELVVLITPRAIRGMEDARDVTNEFRRKMESLRPLTSPPDASAVGQRTTTVQPASTGLRVEPAASNPAGETGPVSEPAPDQMRFEREMSPRRPESRPPQTQPRRSGSDVVAELAGSVGQRLDLKVSERLRVPQVVMPAGGGVNQLWSDLLAVLAPSPGATSSESPAANP